MKVCCSRANNDLLTEFVVSHVKLRGSLRASKPSNAICGELFVLRPECCVVQINVVRRPKAHDAQLWRYLATHPSAGINAW